MLRYFRVLGTHLPKILAKQNHCMQKMILQKSLIDPSYAQ